MTDQTDFSMLVQHLELKREPSTLANIIAVQPRHEFATRLSMPTVPSQGQSPTGPGGTAEARHAAEAMPVARRTRHADARRSGWSVMDRPELKWVRCKRIRQLRFHPSE